MCFIKITQPILLSCLIAPCVAASYASDSLDFTNYCTQAGGKVQEMAAEFSTAAGNVVGFTKSFCTFTADNGLAVIGLESFASNSPNIAATYMKKLDEISENSLLWKGVYANPSHNVCKNLGGASISSGGFANDLGQVDICVFGDASMVSAWTLIYMANHRTGYQEIKEQVKSEPLMMNIPS